MNSQHSIWDLHNGEVVSHTICLNKAFIPSFTNFLKDIYMDLTSRKEECENFGKLSKISFENFMDLPLIVTEKIFRTFDKEGKESLDLEEFVNGLYFLYAGSIEEKVKLIFEIFDSQQAGRIMKDDVLLLLSYLHQTEYDDEMETLNEINDNFWGNCKSMDLTDFVNTIENKNSDVLILFLLYLQMLKPFNDESVKFYHQIKTHSLNKFPHKGKNFSMSSLDEGRDYHSGTQVHDIVEYYLFNKIILPTKTLVVYIIHNFHLNLQLPARKSSVSLIDMGQGHPLSSTNSSNSIKNPDSEENLNSHSFLNQLINANTQSQSHSNIYNEEDLSHSTNEKINVLGSPVYSEISHTSNNPQNSNEESHCFEDHSCVGWDGEGSSNQLPLDSKEKLNLSSINHHRCYHGHDHNSHYNHDHSFSSFSSELSFSKNSHSHLTDDHTEIEVYKINKSVKSYKLVSIGNLIYLFKNDTLNTHSIQSQSHAPSNLFPHYSSTNFILNNEMEHESNLDYKNYKCLHHLSGCFVDTHDGVNVNGENYYPMKFTSSNGGKVIYDLFYVKNFEDLKLFVEKLKFKMGIRNIADYYELYEELGKGQFGSVRLARNRKTSEKVAVKIIKKTYLKSKEIQMIKWELDIMRFLKHTTNPYVVKTHDIFEGKSSYYIVLEYLEGGNLSNHLVELGVVIKESFAKEIMGQVVKGVKYLHQFGIMHRDLKPENLMLVKKCTHPQIKIMDFGLSKVVSFNDRTSEGYGSLCYLAPEILLKQGYDHKVDVWSLGVILYYLLCGYLPFDDSKDEIVKIARRIVNLDLSNIFNDKTRHFSTAFKNLLIKCFERNPLKRISSAKMAENDWFHSK
jgi:Ca2+-binding EF-hand superfamily protein